MARLLTQKEVYSIINGMVEDITGQESTINVVDTSSFISAGELIQPYGTENILKSLGLMVGKILIESREYRGSFELIDALNTEEWTHIVEAISFYNKKALPSGAWNTDLYKNLAPGFTNGQNPDANDDPQSTKSMWEQHPGIPLVMYFAGSSVWDECITIYEVQLQQAFRSPDAFNEFVSGMLLEHNNDIELEKEAFRRAIVLNHIAGTYDLSSVMPGSVINMTEVFNDKYGTDYTTEQLLSTYLKEFTAVYVSTIKGIVAKFKNKSSNYHWTPAKTIEGVSYPLLRSSDRSTIKMFQYAPFWRDAEAMVMPELFNDRYLDIGNYEAIEFWQNENEPSKIDVTPAIPDTYSTSGTYGTQIKGDRVQLDCVLGCVFDRLSMASDFQLERVDASPLEARKLYRNLWAHFSKNGINNFTHKACILVAFDPSDSNSKSKKTTKK